MGITENPYSASYTFQMPTGASTEIEFEGMGYSDYYEGDWENYYGQNDLEPSLYMTNRDKSYWYQFLP